MLLRPSRPHSLFWILTNATRPVHAAEAHAKRAENEAHRQAVATTTKSLARMRQEQKQQLQNHQKIHQAQEHERATAAVREAQMLEAHRAELVKARAHGHSPDAPVRGAPFSLLPHNGSNPWVSGA